MQLANYLNHTEQYKAAEVGMSVTEVLWTDRVVHTVIAVTPSGKTATIQRNRSLGGEYANGGYYATERDPHGMVTKIRLGKYGWRRGNTKFLMDVNAPYRDINF
jgi:hypothetical protein